MLMNKVKTVKVFSKKLSNLQSRELCNELDGRIVKDGRIKSKGKVYNIEDYEVIDGTYYEFEADEKFGLSMLKNNVKQAKDLYDSAIRKQKRYERLLLDKVDKNAVICEDERNVCECSPFGKCCYGRDEDGNNVCVFCGRVEERWILR